MVPGVKIESFLQFHPPIVSYIGHIVKFVLTRAGMKFYQEGAGWVLVISDSAGCVARNLPAEHLYHYSLMNVEIKCLRFKGR